MYNVRLYFKRTGKFPFIWSFDRGSLETQKVVKEFHIAATCKVQSGQDYYTKVENSPKVFVDVSCNKITVMNNVLYLD